MCRAVLTQAAFSYIGVEITAIAGGEAKNPGKSLLAFFVCYASNRNLLRSTDIFNL